MARLRSNNVFGTLTNNPLTNTGTTMNSAGLANLVAVAGVDRAVITLDPNRVNGAPEIVYVTAHTGSATSATILRGQEGTAARQHPSGTFWVHAPTALDLALGQIGYDDVVGDQGGITTTETDVTGLAVTFMATANRRTKVTYRGAHFSSVANDTAVIRLKEGATQLVSHQSEGLNPTRHTHYHAEVVLTPSAGAHTYKVTVQRNGGSGNITHRGTATDPAFILVEDIGAA